MSYTAKLLTLALALSLAPIPATASESVELLNASYDPTREFYEKYNEIFANHWQKKTGQSVRINQSHGGSGKQARSVIEGLRADVVTLALAYDIDVIAEKGKLLPTDWQKKFPNNSSPYSSVIVFLVRKDNPKNIKDWDDLVRDDVQVITPNPKVSGGARWNYLAAWGYASDRFAGDENKIKDFMRKLFRNVPVLDTGARGATTSFVQRNIADVLIAWENEAFLSKREMENAGLEIIYPSVSILTEPPVAVVEKNTQRKKTTEAANEYISFLYTYQAQQLAADHFYRPTDKILAGKYAPIFPSIKKLLTIADFGGWKQAQKEHFADDASFDQIYGAE